MVGECAEKSALFRRLGVELVGRGLTVSTIKQVSDAVDLARQGSGTWKHRAAGAAEVMIASASRFALLHEMPPALKEPEADDLLARMAPVDIVVLDGFRRSSDPNLEIVPAGPDKALLAPADPMVLAVTSDLPVAADVSCLALSNIGALADFVTANARVPGNT